MKSRDFCYWLQGYFELSSEREAMELDARQVDLVKRHLDMVFVHEGKNANPFCHWLQGVFQGYGSLGLNQPQVTAVRGRLHDVFKHEIDPSFPASQQGPLDEAHQGRPSIVDPGNMIMKC